MLEDSTDEFYMASSGEGVSGRPYSWRHSTGALAPHVMRTPWLADAPATRAMTMVPPQALALWIDTDLPFE
jgi:hypothetical protein